MPKGLPWTPLFVWLSLALFLSTGYDCSVEITLVLNLLFTKCLAVKSSIFFFFPMSSLELCISEWPLGMVQGRGCTYRQAVSRSAKKRGLEARSLQRWVDKEITHADWTSFPWDMWLTRMYEHVCVKAMVGKQYLGSQSCLTIPLYSFCLPFWPSV